MLDPQAVLGQARQGRAPANWRVFTKERSRVRGFLRGTSKWRSASFADRYQTVQAFIEAYGAHQAFRSSGLHPR